MRQLVLCAPFDMKLEQAEKPEAGAGQALLKVRAVGICGSDVHAYRGHQPFVTYPRILGHELGCEIAEIAPGEHGFKAGEPVTIEPYIGCGKCYPCSLGRYNCCANIRVMGVHADGGMRDYFAVDIGRIHRAPAGSTFEELAMVETASVGAHGVKRARVEAGETVLIIGAGPIGIGAMQYAKAHGARTIVMDIAPASLEMALKLGADATIDSSASEPVAEVMKLTGGLGAHAVVEAVGLPDTIQLTVELVAPAGRIAIVGVGDRKVTFPQQIFNKKEIDYFGVRNSRGLFPEIINLVSRGLIRMGPLVTHRFSADQGPEAFRFVHENQRQVRKAVLLFS